MADLGEHALGVLGVELDRGEGHLDEHLVVGAAGALACGLEREGQRRERRAPVSEAPVSEALSRIAVREGAQRSGVCPALRDRMEAIPSSQRSAGVGHRIGYAADGEVPDADTADS